MADMPLRTDSVRANPETASLDSNRHNRRAMLGAIAGVPLAATFGTIALPASGELDTLIAHYHHHRDRFNEAGRANMEWTNKAAYGGLEDAFHRSLDRLDSFKARTPQELCKALFYRFEDGALPTGEMWAKIVADAKRLAGEA